MTAARHLGRFGILSEYDICGPSDLASLFSAFMLAPNLAYRSGLVIDDRLPPSVQCLNILLIGTLRRYEHHGRLHQGDRNGLCIVSIVFLPFHERLQILKTDHFDFMAEFLEFSLPAEGDGTSLNAYQAPWGLHQSIEKIFALNALLEQNVAGGAQAAELEYRDGPRRLDRDRDLINEIFCLSMLDRAGAEDDPKKATKSFIGL